MWPDSNGNVLREQAVDKGRRRRARLAQGLNVPIAYASTCHSLRPCRTAFLNSLRGIQIQSPTLRADLLGRRCRVCQHIARTVAYERRLHHF